MNGAHWHLVVNHLPIIIPMIGLLVMIGALLFKSEILKRASYSIFILGALTAIAAFSSGEGAEEVVEEIQGVDEKFIKIHEEAGEIFAILMYLLGGVSILGLWLNWKGKSFSNPVVLLTLALALAALFYAQKTGTTGGEIRHIEIRNDSPNQNTYLNQDNDDDD